MMNDIIISIRPQYAEAIFSGVKRIEWRYKTPLHDVNRVWVYETGTGHITGWFKYSGLTPRIDYRTAFELYGPENITGDPSSDLDRIRSIFAGRKLRGMMITEARRINPIGIHEFGVSHAPTSWAYNDVRPDEWAATGTAVSQGG